jgi:hypothetical protein
VPVGCAEVSAGVGAGIGAGTGAMLGDGLVAANKHVCVGGMEARVLGLETIAWVLKTLWTIMGPVLELVPSLVVGLVLLLLGTRGLLLKLVPTPTPFRQKEPPVPKPVSLLNAGSSSLPDVPLVVAGADSTSLSPLDAHRARAHAKFMLTYDQDVDQDEAAVLVATIEAPT